MGEAVFSVEQSALNIKKVLKINAAGIVKLPGQIIRIAGFLYPHEKDARQAVFQAVKKLYNTRSQAVHGTKMKGDITTAVDESADILRKLLVRCVEIKSMPNENDLIP